MGDCLGIPHVVSFFFFCQGPRGDSEEGSTRAHHRRFEDVHEDVLVSPKAPKVRAKTRTLKLPTFGVIAGVTQLKCNERASPERTASMITVPLASGNFLGSLSHQSRGMCNTGAWCAGLACTGINQLRKTLAENSNLANSKSSMQKMEQKRHRQIDKLMTELQTYQNEKGNSQSS